MEGNFRFGYDYEYLTSLVNIDSVDEFIFVCRIHLPTFVFNVNKLKFGSQTTFLKYNLRGKSRKSSLPFITSLRGHTTRFCETRTQMDDSCSKHSIAGDACLKYGGRRKKSRTKKITQLDFWLIEYSVHSLSNLKLPRNGFSQNCTCHYQMHRFPLSR